MYTHTKAYSLYGVRCSSLSSGFGRYGGLGGRFPLLCVFGDRWGREEFLSRGVKVLTRNEGMELDVCGTGRATGVVDRFRNSDELGFWNRSLWMCFDSALQSESVAPESESRFFAFFCETGFASRQMERSWGSAEIKRGKKREKNRNPTPTGSHLVDGLQFVTRSRLTFGRISPPKIPRVAQATPALWESDKRVGLVSHFLRVPDSFVMVNLGFFFLLCRVASCPLVSVLPRFLCFFYFLYYFQCLCVHFSLSRWFSLSERTLRPSTFATQPKFA